MQSVALDSSFDTLCTHGGIGSGDGNPLVTPIVQSTTFCRDGVDSTCEHQYSRVSNPTLAALEDTLGQMEDAPRAVCFATGLAAETALFLSLLKAGDHVVCGRAVYGGTTRFLQQFLPHWRIETTFVDSTDVEHVRAAVTNRTQLIFIETPANPTLEVTNIRAVADIAHECGALLAVDNTFLTAVLQQPLDHGADISVYSTTKFIDGHSVALGGALVARNEELLERFRFTRKSTGATQSPFNAWLTLQGLKTLPLRIHRQSETAETIARWLGEHESVDHVFYPALTHSQQQAVAEKQHLGAHGAVIAFEVAGGLDTGRDVVERLQLCTLVEHVGSVETLITHPATMTHADVPSHERCAAGISDGLLRLSVGLEDPKDIIADLEQALLAANPVVERNDQEVEACLAIG